jgi:hypothetical protein
MDRSSQIIDPYRVHCDIPGRITGDCFRCCRCRNAEKNKTAKREQHAHHCNSSYHFVVAVWRAKEAESGRMKCRHTTVAILAALSVSLLLADDFKTANGNEYKNVTVTKQEPDGITVMNKKTGVFVKLYFTELPKEVQQRFNYDPKKAAAYLRQKAKATQKNNKHLTKEQAGIQWTGQQLRNVQALQVRYQQLQEQEADLLRRIGTMQSLPDLVQGRSGRHYYGYNNPLRANLPSLQSQLSDVRREKAQVSEQLARAQP